MSEQKSVTASSSQPQPITGDDLEDLVAYLDGELDESRSQVIEKSLGDREELRREVDSLQRSWDLLDLLTVEKASDNFTQRTLDAVRTDELASTEAVSSDRVWGERGRRYAVLAGWLLSTSFVAGVAFLTANRWIETDGDALVRQLPVVERYDDYTNAGSVEFLEKLHGSGVLDDFEAAADDD